MSRSDGAAARHLTELIKVLGGFDGAARTTEKWDRALAEVLPGGGRLLAAGNGGSAAQAQHLTAEIVGRYAGERQPFSALALPRTRRR